MEIAEFVTARLDDDERYARLFLALGKRLKDNPSPAMTAIGKAGIDAVLDAPEAVEEAMRWKCRAPNDLERVLREVAAKRAIVANYEGTRKITGDDDEYAAGLAYALQALASAWSDHPDYDPKWRA